MDPSIQLASGKQRSLCLTADHDRCATYLAALQLRGPQARVDDTTAALWPQVSAVPVLLEAARVPGPTGAGPMNSGWTQTLLVGLMGIAFVVLVASRVLGPQLEGAGAGATPTMTVSPASPTATPVPSATVPPSATPSVTPAPSASPTPAPTPAPTPTPSPVATATPTPAPTATPAPSIATKSYRVVAGDTLYTIALQFDTTVAVLADLNGITDPSVIQIGQILRVPA